MKFTSNFDMPDILPTYTSPTLSLPDDFETSESLISEQIEELYQQQSQQLEELCHQTSVQERQIKAVEGMAESAKQQAESAESEARQSRRQSRISNIIAIASAIISILAWLIPRDLVVHFLSSIIS